MDNEPIANDPVAAWPPQVVCLQFQVCLGRPEASLARLRELLAAAAPAPGTLVLLPELWAAGFSYPELAARAGQTPELLAALRELAGAGGLTLAGSLPEAAAGGGFYNTLFLVAATGVVASYRKQRLFAPMAEDRHFRPGGDPGPLAAPWGPTAALVCFDLRFPELATAQVDRGAELLLVSAQWPAVRREHWRILLQARAIENQIFVAACNTCGRIGETEFAGNSMIIAPDGTVLAEAGPGETAITAPLHRHRLQEARRLFTTRR